MQHLTLGIETSCDDTCAAVVQNGQEVLSSAVSSQAEIHSLYGGVVPELASRNHSRNFVPLIDAALDEAGVNLCDIDLVAATRGPGLTGSLLVGMMGAKGLAWGLGVPFCGVNHLLAHIWAAALDEGGGSLPETAVCLIASGGHTELVYLKEHGTRGMLLGQTRDDAAGEAFDKVARVLGLGYPGGPAIDNLASDYDGITADLPRPMLQEQTYDMSFSGLKTAVMVLIEDISGKKPENLTRLSKEDSRLIAASFQEAVVDVLVARCIAGLQETDSDILVVVGGVAANSLLRHRLQTACGERNIGLIIPRVRYCTDNAAMVAAAGYAQADIGCTDSLDVDVDASLGLSLPE